MGKRHLKPNSIHGTSAHQSVGRVLAFAFATLLTSACGTKSTTTSEFQSECAVEQNQVGTLSGRWKQFPIPLAVREGQFSTDEVAAIGAAVKTWNKFFMKTEGKIAIDFGTDAAPRTSTVDKPLTASSCNATLLSNDGSTFTSDVVIYKRGTWPYTQNTDQIALTTFCKKPSAALLIPSMYWAMIEVNYQNFFVDGKTNPDLTTNILHELGHLLGLDHSCISGTGRDTFISCSDTNLSADYSTAIMYPFDMSADGVLKRKTKANDQQRMNCLYGDTAYPWTNATPTPSATSSSK